MLAAHGCKYDHRGLKQVRRKNDTESPNGLSGKGLHVRTDGAPQVINDALRSDE